MVGTLTDKGTGKPLLIDGKEVKAEKTFKAKKSKGKVEVTFTFPGISLEGRTIVVFEELYQKNEKLVVHADIEDEEQTVHFPEVGITARDSDTGEKIANADQEVTLIDTVSYKNLIPGVEYKITGTLMDKGTKKVVKVDGRPVTAESVFTAEEADGSIDVTFVFNGSGLKGKTVVAFESLTYHGKELAIHADLAYEGQTIRFPKIQTTALDSDTGDHLANANGDVTIVDTVKYENLLLGKEYKIAGILMDKGTGKELLVNGQTVTARTNFVPEQAQGSVDVVFTFDGSALTENAVTAFETLTYQKKEIASHAELEDEGQTVYFPEIHTTAKDSEIGDSLSNAGEEVTLVDMVEYKNLLPGREYRVTGTLMDKETGQAVEADGKPVTAETVFVPEKMSGAVDVTFVFDGTALKGKTVVVFETVALGENELAVHTDLEDEGQTIHFPEIGTTAADSETGCHVAKGDTELAPEGSGYRLKTRFSKFYNLPELMQMFREAADIQTADMLDLPVPEAEYRVVTVKPSKMQKKMVEELGNRAERVRNGMVDPSRDNMLSE